MYESIKFKDDKDWLAWRLDHIMASEMPSLLGFNSMESGNQLLIRKRADKQLLLEGKMPVKQSNFNTRRGNGLEPAVAKFLEIDFGISCKLVGADSKVVFYNEHLEVAATLDALWDATPVELKTTDNRKFNLYWRKGPPPIKYLVQTAMQIVCLETEFGHLGGMVSREVPSARVKEVFPDYQSPYPSVDISTALYTLRVVDELREMLVHYTKRGKEALSNTSMWRMSLQDHERIQELLIRETHGMVVDGITWIEDEWKTYGYQPKTEFTPAEGL